jgi:hypothetical protein
VIENIRRNAAKNIPTQLSENCRVEGHAWGILDTPLAMENKHRFTRILAADCYWLSGQHENLVRSMLHFLSLEPTARVFVIAGFHTGRARLANFFEVADASSRMKFTRKTTRANEGNGYPSVTMDVRITQSGKSGWSSAG